MFLRRNTKSLIEYMFDLLTIWSNNIILMHPKGIIGQEEKRLIIIAIIAMLIVVIPVIIMTLYFSFSYNESNNLSKYKPNWHQSKLIESVVWFIPIAIVSFLSMVTLSSTNKLDPKKLIMIKNKKPIVIQAISIDWKWLFIYPEQGIATINEITFPIETPIQFQITSDTVMNSFFIPQLGSQIYAMGGMRSRLNILASKPGQYRGMSSHFSGYGFSGMKFNVNVVDNKEKFNKWIEKNRKSNKKIKNIKDYNEIYKRSVNNKAEYFSQIKKNFFNDVIRNAKRKQKR